MIQSTQVKRFLKTRFITGTVVYKFESETRLSWFISFKTAEGHFEDMTNQRGEMRRFASIDSACKFLNEVDIYDFEVLSGNASIDEMALKV